MKTLTGFLLALIVFTIYSCSTTQKSATINKNSRMEFTITKVQNETDGQTLFLKDDKGNKFTTIISIPNGNFVDVKEGNRISLIVKDIINMKPIAIVSRYIKVLNLEYEKTEEKIYWVNSKKVKANGMWGQPMECLQIQKSKQLNKNGEWQTVCDEIEYFQHIEGTYYQIKVLKKWLKNHENLMDRAPYDLELITVLSKEKDPTYINPIKTKITTNKNTYNVGEPIILSMEVKNTGEKPYTFLPWKTPIENSFTGEFLNIIHNNKTIEYSGIMVKRMPPTLEDFITLKTDETATGKVNILDGYQLTEKGIYTIDFKEEDGGLPKSNGIKIDIR